MRRTVSLLWLAAACLLTACTMANLGSTTGEGESFAIVKNKGQAYLERGVPVMALPALQRAREMQPNDPDVLLMLGMAYDQSDRPLQALEALEKAREIQPGNGRINNNLGVALMRVERLEEARASFEAALTDVNYPTPEEVYFNLAALRKRQGLQREMLNMLDEALKVRPGYVPALLELAMFHRNMGRPDLEQARLRRVLEEIPEHLVAMDWLAESCMKVGKNGEAREWLRKIQALAPGSHAARRAAEKLAILEKVP